MSVPQHGKNREKRIEELTFSEQAKSITATINNLAAAIRRHVRTSPMPGATQEKCRQQIVRLLSRI